jgi:hypothetical protein
MRSLLLLVPALVALRGAEGQTGSNWRFGVFVTAPSHVLDVNSPAPPDSIDTKVGLGIGFGAELARAWHVKPTVSLSLRGAVTSASVKEDIAGGDFSPGRALLIDAGGRAERQTGARSAIFGGAFVSHWMGPDNVAPFEGIGAIQLGTEAGFSLRPGEGSTRIDISASLTRIGGDDARGIATGFVWRFSLGVRRGA